MSVPQPPSGGKDPSQRRKLTNADGPARRRITRMRRGFARGALFVALCVAILLAAFLVALQSPSISTWMANAALRHVPAPPGAQWSVQAARGNWIRRIELNQLQLARGDTVLVGAKIMKLELQPWSSLAGRIALGGIEIGELQVSAKIASVWPDGGTAGGRDETLTPAAMLRGQFYRGPRLRIHRLELRRGTYEVTEHPDSTEKPLVRLDLTAHDLELGSGFAGRVDSLELRYTPLGRDASAVDLLLAASVGAGRLEVSRLQLGAAGGAVRGRANFDPGSHDSTRAIEVMLRADSLDLGTLARLTRNERFSGRLAVDVDLRGPELRRLTGNVHASLSEARLGGLHVGPGHWTVALTDGHAAIDGSFDWDGARAMLQGEGWPLAEVPSYDLVLALDGLPRRIPGVPHWEPFAQRATPVTRLHLSGQGVANAALHVEGEIASDAGGLQLRGGLRFQPEIEWEVERLQVTNLDAARWIGDSRTSDINATLTARGRGVTPESRWLTVAWDLAASAYGGWKDLSGKGAAHLEGTHLGARMQLATDAGQWSLDSLIVRLPGDPGARQFEVTSLRFRSVDPARISGNTQLQGDLSGRLTLQGVVAENADVVEAPIWQRLDATGRLLLDPSTFRARKIEEVDAALRCHEGTLQAEVSLTSDAGRGRLHARARPFDVPAVYEVDAFHFTDVDVSAWSQAGPSTRLNGSLDGKWTMAAPRQDGAGPSGAAGGNEEATLPYAAATLHFSPSVFGSLPVSAGTAHAAWSHGDFDLKGNLQTAAGEIALQGNLPRGWKREGPRMPGERGGEGKARAVVPFGVLTALAGHDTLSAAGELRIEAGLRGAASGVPELEARITGSGRMDALQVDSFAAALRLSAGVLQVDTLEVRSNAGTAEAFGRVAFPGAGADSTADLRLHIGTERLDPLRALLGADSLALENGQIEVHLTGSPSARDFRVNASVEAMTWDDVHLRSAQLEAEGLLGRSWRPQLITAKARIADFRRASAVLQEATLQARFEEPELRFDFVTQLDEAHRASLVGTAARDSSGFLVHLTAMDLQGRTARWQLARPAQLQLGNGRLALDALDLRANRSFIHGAGILDRRGEQDFRLQASEVELDFLSVLLARKELGGRMDGVLSVSGPAEAPHVEGSLRLAVRSAEVPVGVAEAQLEWDGREARFFSFFASPENDSLTVSGSVPFRSSFAEPDPSDKPAEIVESPDEVHLRIRAHRFPLSACAPLLPPGSVSALEGTLDADVRFSGRSRALLGEGQFGLRDGVLGLPSIGTTYESLRLDCALSGDRIVVRQARVTTGKGGLELSGEVRVASLTRIEPNLEARFQNFSFTNTPDLTARASGDLRWTGTSSAPRIEGRLVANSCSYYITPAALAGAGSSQEVSLTPEDIRMMEETFGDQAKPRGSSSRDIFDASDLDLRVSLGRDNWVRKRSNPRLALEIAGEVHVRKPPHGELDLQGHIEPLPGRGYIEHFGRTFDFVGGEVLLNGPMKEHTIDIHTQYKVRTPGASGDPDVVVRLDVQSNADEMRLVLSSEPPLSESEIVSYITTGRSPTNPNAGAGSDAAALAADIGLSQVTGVLEDVVQEKVGLDVLQVRYDPLQGATLVAGRYMNPTLYIGLQQPLQYRDKGVNATQNPFQTAVEVEYEAYRWLVVNLQGEASLLRSFIRASHAY